MELLIKNTTAVSMDDANPVVERCYIGVNQGKICWFSQQPPEEPADRTIDGAGKLALPGLVNAYNIKNYGISGCTILGDGNISIILDVANLFSAVQGH